MGLINLGHVEAKLQPFVHDLYASASLGIYGLAHSMRNCSESPVLCDEVRHKAPELFNSSLKMILASLFILKSLCIQSFCCLIVMHLALACGMENL